MAEVETCTAREWIRIGRLLRLLPATADAFANREISYAKVRALTRIATPDNEIELLEIARTTQANDLARALAAWLNRTSDPDELAAYQHRQRSLTWRTEPDGMTRFTLRLPPLPAGRLISGLTAVVMRGRPQRQTTDDPWPTLAQQHADALDVLVREGAGEATTEIVLHVRGDGATLDDGTPIAGTVVERIASTAFLRALIHDAEGHPINASGRQRHPTDRQRRVVKERDRCCVDCGRQELLTYDHVPEYEVSHHTIVDELQLRCASCHRQRHRRSFTAGSATGGQGGPRWF